MFKPYLPCLLIFMCLCFLFSLFVLFVIHIYVGFGSCKIEKGILVSFNHFKDLIRGDIYSEIVFSFDPYVLAICFCSNWLTWYLPIRSFEHIAVSVMCMIERACYLKVLNIYLRLSILFQDVGLWLEEINLGSYRQVFEENGVNGEYLESLSMFTTEQILRFIRRCHMKWGDFITLCKELRRIKGLYISVP